MDLSFSDGIMRLMFTQSVRFYQPFFFKNILTKAIFGLIL